LASMSSYPFIAGTIHADIDGSNTGVCLQYLWPCVLYCAAHSHSETVAKTPGTVFEIGEVIGPFLVSKSSAVEMVFNLVRILCEAGRISTEIWMIDTGKFPAFVTPAG